MSEVAQQQAGPTGPPGTTGPKEKTSTSYIVLEDLDTTTGQKCWREAGTYNAVSARAAVKSHVESNKLDKGSFVAVPKRSFDPVTVKIETQTKLAFS
jgi:hypothetical protein